MSPGEYFCSPQYRLPDSQLQECIPVGCLPLAHWPYCLVLFFWGAGGGVTRSDEVWPGLTRDVDQVWLGEDGVIRGCVTRSDQEDEHVTYPMMHLMSPPEVGQTDACENITFPRFDTRAVTSAAKHKAIYWLMICLLAQLFLTIM